MKNDEKNVKIHKDAQEGSMRGIETLVLARGGKVQRILPLISFLQSEILVLSLSRKLCAFVEGHDEVGGEVLDTMACTPWGVPNRRFEGIQTLE
jgi:hypothetical protein